MTVLTINTDYDGDISNIFTKVTNGVTLRIGTISKAPIHTFIRFPLTNLPSDAIISQVRLLVNCTTGGGSSGTWDIHPYNSDGQADPSADTGTTCYTRCAAGTQYINDDTGLRSTGAKAYTLGSAAGTAVLAAKTAATNFSLGMHEEGENDNGASISSLDSGSNYPQLEITYTVPTGDTMKVQVM
ncbi:hypothetical protein MUP38_07055 [Candidatus Bathyarchaeota archaeon]|nr:hypothetical protein [Candidatus Bathyarchaeota archaeon]